MYVREEVTTILLDSTRVAGAYLGQLITKRLGCRLGLRLYCVFLTRLRDVDVMAIDD